MNGKLMGPISYWASVAQSSSTAVLIFFHTKGTHFIQAVCKVFLAKVISQVFYGVQICIFTKFNTLEAVQSKFIRAILAVPRGIKNAAL